MGIAGGKNQQQGKNEDFWRLHGKTIPADLLHASVFLQKYGWCGRGFRQSRIFVNNMDLKSISELRGAWELLCHRLAQQFGIEPDLQGVIFLIGVQELGQGFRKFTKDEKQDLMHIATCKLLSVYGFYELTGSDHEGWPHWKLIKKLPVLTLKEQDLLLKRAVLDYFESA
jgi:hypothetical protein